MLESGSYPTDNCALAAQSATACSSAGSIPARSTARVTIRYIAPVSRNRDPRPRANPLDTEDFPVPAGPSIATTNPTGAGSFVPLVPLVPALTTLVPLVPTLTTLVRSFHSIRSCRSQPNRLVQLADFVAA
ncbi:hypothetical protein NJB1728216S_19330 [Mycobacterium marinum]|uniref:Uncharacterized protein n=1 Tax=Mycobacterium shottsii TaxID=133549 RepID=A0A7I7LG23_9MYCO|nr:hypothetical protein MSHO_38070 [Mycobacterium shottsii]GJN98329.1 hypothetical protein NJB1907f34b_09580 [Mycobacterium marinum]GJO02672.1 hypothetical protein NJB1907E90_08230 [Mycobacterium marinum]GJO15515.1 hypothetical protein NJB1728e18_07800 [Mycobacterium marinum]GJO17481.1 hypothetical protein NJB1907E11_20310 [Mycobacterium marinum]